MKILHVISGVSLKSGGTSEVVPRLCQELKSIGEEVRLLTLKWGPISLAAEHAVSKGVNITFCRRNNLPFFQSLGISSEFARNAFSYASWADIIHLHCLWQWPCWKVANIAKRLHKPYVVQTHGFLEPERLKKSRLKKKIIGKVFECPLLSSAKFVIATAESEKKGILDYGVSTPVDIVPIGLETTEFDAASRNETLLSHLIGPQFSIRHPKILLFFSRIAPIKGLDLLADAWASLESFHSKWQLVIVGPSDRGYEDVIKQYFSSKVSDGSVSFPGPIYGKEKYDLLKSADAFVLPTRSENFGIAVQEALAAGVPTVCTKGAPWENIEKKNCGYWVDVSVDGIRNGLMKIMSASDEERMTMGISAKQFIKEEFEWSKIARQMLDVYRRSVN